MAWLYRKSQQCFRYHPTRIAFQTKDDVEAGITKWAGIVSGCPGRSFRDIDTQQRYMKVSGKVLNSETS